MHAVLDKGLYRISNPKTGMVLKKIINQCRLTAYVNSLRNHATPPSDSGDPVHATPHSDSGDPIHATPHSDSGDPVHTTSPSDSGDPVHTTPPSDSGDPVHATPYSDSGDPVHATPHSDSGDPEHTTSTPRSPTDLESLLFDNSLIRLWRTGAEFEVYSSNEDADPDVSWH